MRKLGILCVVLGLAAVSAIGNEAFAVHPSDCPYGHVETGRKLIDRHWSLFQYILSGFSSGWVEKYEVSYSCSPDKPTARGVATPM